MSYYGPAGGGGNRGFSNSNNTGTNNHYSRGNNNDRPPWRGGGARFRNSNSGPIGSGTATGIANRDQGYRGRGPGGIQFHYSPPIDSTRIPRRPPPAWHVQYGTRGFMAPPPPTTGVSPMPSLSPQQGQPPTGGTSTSTSDRIFTQPVHPSQFRETTDNNLEENAEDLALFVDWELETKRRNDVFLQLMNLYGQQRVQAFRALSPEEQLIFFFPDDVTSNSLPPMDPPSDWEQRIQMTIQRCKDDVMNLFRKRPFHNVDHMDRDRDSDMDSDSSHSSPGGFNAPDPWEEHVAFLQALEYCLPMTAAFHVLTIFARAGDNQCCYCPCGRHMDKWRRFASLQDFATCDFKGRKDPASLWKHVLTKQEDCPIHKIIYLFLKTVFQNYHYEGIQHIALEDNQSPAYKKAERYIMRDLKLQIDALRREAKEKHELEAQLRKAKADHATLQQINIELASKLEAEKKLKEKFGALDSTEATLTPIQAQFAKSQFDIFRQDVIMTLERENVDKKSTLEPVLTLDHGFNSIQVFERLYKTFVLKPNDKSQAIVDAKTFAFLFTELPYSKRKDTRIRQAETRAQIAKNWEIKTRQDAKLIREIGRATGLSTEDLKTKDKGGPTRYFFSRLWNQLGDLSVSVKEYSGGREIVIKLFESSQGGLIPITDEKLLEVELNKIKEGDRTPTEVQIKAYFRAVGRILAHCFLKNIVVSTHILPDLYKTVLLRGLDIEKDEYPLGVLIDHAGALLDVDYSKTSEPPEMLLQRKLGLLDSELEDSIPLRQKIKELFVDNRKLSLDCLRDGLSLGQVVTWRSVFGWVPTTTVNQMVFGRQDISDEMVFNADGKLRFIQFAQDWVDESKSTPYKETQELFEVRMTELIQDKMRDDPSFITNFVEFCTGSPFIPDIDLNPDFHLRLEFNGSEMEEDFLPVVHTCDNCIKIPAQAYEADIEVFQAKLATAMGLSQTNFDMQ